MASDLLQRLAARNRKLKTNKIRTALHARAPRNVIKLTNAEKKARKEKAQLERGAYKVAMDEILELIHQKAEFLHAKFGGHSVQWYKLDIMQQARLNGAKRAPSRWNAYIKMEVQKLSGDGGLTKDAVPGVMKSLSQQWGAMSKEEQAEATNDAMKDLAEYREIKKLAAHNAPINVFHDTRANLEKIERDLAVLHARTNNECLLIVVRSSSDHYNEPFLFFSSPKVADFINLAYNQTGADMALKLEAYCISGVSGYVKNQVEATALMKKDTAALIIDNLRKITHTNIPRMIYATFEDSITSKYGVVVEGWPLPKFCSPADLISRMEVQVLFRAWESGQARFHQLSDDELQKWEGQRFNERMSMTNAMDQHVEEHATATPSDMPIFRSNEENPPVLPATQPAIQASSSVASPALQLSSHPLQFVNHSVTTSDNTPIMYLAKQRKQRSDKGKKRGTGKAQQENSMPTPAQPPAALASTT